MSIRTRRETGADVLGNNQIIALLGTADADAARSFYEGKLGLKFVYEDDFALVLSGGGTELRIQKLASVTLQAQTALGWSVDDIAATVAGLGDAGVTFERFDGMAQDASGIWDAPSGGRIAWFKDPDGNLLSLTQHA